ncbi:hypothetical protein BDB01DRAFT_768661 [Pilobolus umbonatus]|nr:hypothetical protein BDB01DRAFT_768661 [Pilobolus umbonatus]
MSHQSMSINQMLQPKEEPRGEKELTRNSTGKVKIFYTFKGSETHCLCSLDIILEEDIDNKEWISVPLRKCLLSVCSSCPDQLMNNDTAIYSANFEESKTVDNWSPLHDSRSNIIWEGHGLLSNILSDNNSSLHATGKITKATSSNYLCNIEVLIQLHPIRQSPIQSNMEQTHVLPPMRSIWAEPSVYSGGNLERQSNHTNDMSNDNSTSFKHSSCQQFPAYPYSIQRDSVNDTPRVHYPSTPIPRDISNDEQPVYKSNTEPNWPGSRYDPSNYENDIMKRRRLSDSVTPHITTKRLIPTSKSLRATNNTTDTYYHQSRRKKRDTKPPNANDIRPFVEVERDEDGNYILPAEVDSWTVLSLGSVIWDRAAFHNQRYIYPVGYRVKKWYRSMVDPHSDTQYTCEILDGGDEPIFQLNADDNPNECWRGPTPTTVWTIAVRRAFAIRNMDYGHNPVGPDFFGLRKNTIAKMIQDLPNANKCKNYIWQNFEAMSNSKGKSVRRTNTRLSSSSSTGSISDKQLLTSSIDDQSSQIAASPHTDASDIQ